MPYKIFVLISFRTLESPTYTLLENAAMSNFNKAASPSGQNFYDGIYDVKKPPAHGRSSAAGGPGGGILGGNSPGVPPPGGIYDPTNHGLYGDIKGDQAFPWGSVPVSGQLNSGYRKD